VVDDPKRNIERKMEKQCGTPDRDLEELHEAIRRGDELLSRSDALLQQQRKIRSVRAAIGSTPSVTEEGPE